MFFIYMLGLLSFVANALVERMGFQSYNIGTNHNHFYLLSYDPLFDGRYKRSANTGSACVGINHEANNLRFLAGFQEQTSFGRNPTQ